MANTVAPIVNPRAAPAYTPQSAGSAPVPVTMSPALAAQRRAPISVPISAPRAATMAPIAAAQQAYEEPGDPFTAFASGWVNASTVREDEAATQAKREEIATAFAKHPDLQKYVTSGAMAPEDALRIMETRDAALAKTETDTARRGEIGQYLGELAAGDERYAKLAEQWDAGVIDEDGLGKALGDIDKAPELTSDQKTLKQINDERAAAGKPPLSMEEFLAQKPSGTTVNVGPTGVDYGDPGAGLVWKRDQEGNILLDERGAPEAIPFKGGKAYADALAAEEKAKVGDRRTDLKANVVVQDIDRALGQIGDNPFMTTGPIGQLTENWGGFPANDARALISTVKANAGFQELQAMREASPTGGALGSITEKEIAYLQSTIGNLEQSQGSQQLIDNLKRVKNAYLDIIHGEGNGPAREQLSFDTAPAADGPARPTTDEEYNALPSGELFIDPDDGKTYRKP